MNQYISDKEKLDNLVYFILNAMGQDMFYDFAYDEAKEKKCKISDIYSEFGVDDEYLEDADFSKGV